MLLSSFRLLKRMLTAILMKQAWLAAINKAAFFFFVNGYPLNDAFYLRGGYSVDGFIRSHAFRVRKATMVFGKFVLI